MQTRCALIAVALALCVVAASASEDNRTGNATTKVCTREASKCRDGLIFPAWRPLADLSTGDTAARAIVYLLGLIFLFLGISIISDRFMSAIEVITSQEREVKIKQPNGEIAVISVRVWNETVSNLTLMALGSSAPEILLSVIEVLGNGFVAGDLGPGTIVGSAAYNLFVIIGVCSFAIPAGKALRIRHLRVFFVTATWSVFAYVWLYIIIAVASPGVIDVWEGVLTFLFFPATVLSAYITDKKIFFGRFLQKKVRKGRIKGKQHGTDEKPTRATLELLRGPLIRLLLTRPSRCRQAR